LNAERWQRLERVFLAAQPLASEERISLLARECDSDEGLREEVLALLAAADRSGEFLSESALDALARAMAADPPTFQAGERLGAYVIRDLVGSGGAGEVWRASDERLGRDVAIKVLLPHLLHDRERVLRFEHEARTAGALNHPNILSVYDVGERDGAPYLVSEFVDGESLRDRLRNGALPVQSALEIALQVARGLEAAHARGVIHRDLKPDNVFLRADGGVKLLDFGLATLEGPSLPAPGDDPAGSATGAVAGTVGYMAPEQVRGEPVDARTDLFALGATLHEMLAGARPFRSGSAGEELRAVVEADPAPLPAGPGLTPDLGVLVRQLLAKDPEDRLPSASEAVRRLESLTRAPAERAHRRRLRWVAAAGLGSLLALAAVLAYSWRHGASGLGLGAGGRPAIAVMPFENATGAPEADWLTTGVPQMLLTGLSQTRGLDLVSARRLQEAIEQAGADGAGMTDRTRAAEIAQSAGAGAIVVGSVYSSGGEVRIDAQVEDLATGRVLAADRVRGSQVFALVDELAARIRAGLGFGGSEQLLPTADVSSASLAAYRLYSEGMDAAVRLDWDEAERKLDEAVGLDPAFAEAHLRLAFVHRTTGRVADAREDLRRAEAHAERLSERYRLLLEVELARDAGDAPRQARVLDDLIERYPDTVIAYSYAQGLYDPEIGAIPDIEKLLAITQRGVAVAPAAKETRLTYGYALMQAGRLSEALAELEAYARLAPREPNPFDSLGHLHLLLGEPQKAVEAYARAVAIDPDFGAANGHAYALATLGRYDEALAAGADFAHIQALLLSRVGRYAEADRILAAAVAEAEARENLVRSGGLELLASWLDLERRNYESAARHARTSFDRFSGVPGRWGIGVAGARVALGVIEARSGAVGEARTRLAGLKADPDLGRVQWWLSVLEGEIALAEPDRGSAVELPSWRPPRPSLRLVAAGSVTWNNFGLRDGAARAAEARGDLAAAVAEYRRLLTPGSGQGWIGVYEPRDVLSVARLLTRSGDLDRARAAYERFLGLWKDADPDLPELAEARRAVGGT